MFTNLLEALEVRYTQVLLKNVTSQCVLKFEEFSFGFNTDNIVFCKSLLVMAILIMKYETYQCLQVA